ncbi:MAG: hypothetical protein JXQ67_03950 [Campylobacterales bacterium]|nr:hypothetical protein [Campylobacterales bacterium]
MKLAKMSLAAALLLGMNAYAVENVEVSGDAKLFYGTQSGSYDSSATSEALFNKSGAYADFSASLGVTADLMENVKAGAKMQLISTLGLENDIVSGTWSSGHKANSGVLNTDEWVSEAWLEGKLGATTGKVGRMTLETPLVFTETWSSDYNTFEAAMLTNEDIPDTTLVAAYVATSNGYAADPSGTLVGNVMSGGGTFYKVGEEGAYVLGAINNSVKPLTVQGWYYSMPKTADAYWLQADLEMDGIIAGAQYTSINVDDAVATGDDDTAYAFKLGYAIPDMMTITAAYSAVADTGTYGGVYNFATAGQSAGTASSLYTEYWWWFQTASATGATTMTLSAEGSVSDVDLFLGYYTTDTKPAGSDTDTTSEVAFTASKSFGPLDTSIALLYDMFDYAVGDSEDLMTVQLYFTYNF